MRESFGVTRIARVGHLAHDEQLHLRGKIERTSELQRLDRTGADPFAEIGQVRPADGQGSAGQDAGIVFPEKHPLENGRDIDGRRVQGEELRCFSGSLDPVDVPFGTLFEEGHNPNARLVNAPPQLLQFRFQKLVLGPLYHLCDARLQGNQAPGNGVRREIRLAHAELAAFPEIAALIDPAKERIELVDNRAGQGHAGGVAGDGEKALSGSGVVESLDRGAQAVLRDADPDLAGGRFLN